MKKYLWAAAALLLPVHAWATMIIAVPSESTTAVFPTPGSSFLYTQPLALGEFEITGTSFVYGKGTFVFGENGYWNYPGSQGWFGVNATGGKVVIDLNGRYSTAGVYMNYDPAYSIYIQALNSSMQILETYYLASTYPISSPGLNTGGGFRGITLSSSEIQYLVVGGGPLAIRSVTVAGEATTTPPDPISETPEPATLGAGAIAVFLVLAARRRYR